MKDPSIFIFEKDKKEMSGAAIEGYDDKFSIEDKAKVVADPAVGPIDKLEDVLEDSEKLATLEAQEFHYGL